MGFSEPLIKLHRWEMPADLCFWQAGVLCAGVLCATLLLVKDFQ